MKKGRIKNCGSCVYFLKWRNDRYGGGLCEFLDGRTKSDHGHHCIYWSPIPYNRTENKNEFKRLLNEK